MLSSSLIENARGRASIFTALQAIILPDPAPDQSAGAWLETGANMGHPEGQSVALHLPAASQPHSKTASILASGLLFATYSHEPCASEKERSSTRIHNYLYHTVWRVVQPMQLPVQLLPSGTRTKQKCVSLAITMAIGKDRHVRLDNPRQGAGPAAHVTMKLVAMLQTLCLLEHKPKVLITLSLIGHLNCEIYQIPERH